MPLEPHARPGTPAFGATSRPRSSTVTRRSRPPPSPTARWRTPVAVPPLYAGQFAPSEGDLNQRGPVADAAFQVPERITHEQLVEHGNRLWQQRAATRPPDEGGVPPVPVRVIPPARAVTYEPSPDVLKRRG